jgi:hypothetical protein
MELYKGSPQPKQIIAQIELNDGSPYASYLGFPVMLILVYEKMEI